MNGKDQLILHDLSLVRGWFQNKEENITLIFLQLKWPIFMSLSVCRQGKGQYGDVAEKS